MRKKLVGGLLTAAVALSMNVIVFAGGMDPKQRRLVV